ncbi:MAG: sulfite exporter TauE/SafE family protein [Pseudomonadota bacterium]
MDLLIPYLPEGLPIVSAGILVVAAFFTSAMTAAFGIGGGVALLALMANIVPVAVLIPVHGVIQLGSNAGRALVLRQHIVWPLLAYFAIGALVGALIGGQLVVALPDNLLRVCVGLFVLLSIWGPKPKAASGGPFALTIAGGFATFLTMFVGATGPFVAAVLAPRLDDRRLYTGTHAAAMVMQHGLKVVVFGYLGFAFGAWVPLMVAMIAAGFLGTLAGTRLLHALPETLFRTVFKWVLTALAIQLIASAGWNWLR